MRPRPPHAAHRPFARHPAALAAAFLPTALAISLGGCVSLTPFAEVRGRLPENDFVQIDGNAVHAPRRGAGEPIVLLHGFGASAWSWRGVAPELAASYLTVAIDLNGFGWSERPRAASAYLREGQVDTVIAVLDALRLDRVHLVGHSYGGSVAQALAVLHPERVRSLILVDAARPDYPVTRRSRLAACRPLDTLFVRAFALRPRQVRRALERSFADDTLVSDELVAGYLDRLAVEGAGRAYWGLTRPRRGTAPEIDVARIAVPTLVVWGEDDELISAAGARERTRRIPGARFVTIEGVGHLPMEEAPDRLSQILLRFLAEVDRRDRP